MCVCCFFFSRWTFVSLAESPCLFEISNCFLLEFLGLWFGLVGLYCLARRYWTSHNDVVYSPWTILCNCMGKPPTRSECKWWCNSFFCVLLYIYTRVFLLRLYLCACLFSRREEAYIYNHWIWTTPLLEWQYIHILFIEYKKKKKKKKKNKQTNNKQWKRTEANRNDNTR